MPDAQELQVGEIMIAVSAGEEAIVTCDHPGCRNAIIVQHRNGKTEADRRENDQNMMYSAAIAVAVLCHWGRIARDKKQLSFEYLCADHNEHTRCARCLNVDCSCMGGPRIDRVRFIEEDKED